MLLATAVLAMAWVGDPAFRQTGHSWINDILMTVFAVVVGLPGGVSWPGVLVIGCVAGIGFNRTDGQRMTVQVPA